MTPAWHSLREALRHEGLDVGDGARAPACGLLLRVNGRLTVQLLELAREHRMCLLWGNDGGQAVSHVVDGAWIQHRRLDAGGGVWTTATHTPSGARILASSVCTRAMDTVTYRAWLGDPKWLRMERL